MKNIHSLLAIGLLAATPLAAQEHNHPAPASAPPQGAMMMNGNMQGMGAMLGQHMMSVTVTAIDAKTGIVDATAGAMPLKLHFPPPSLAGMKAGDKISVHLAFHKG